MECERSYDDGEPCRTRRLLVDDDPSEWAPAFPRESWCAACLTPLVEWTQKNRAHGDPVWRAVLGDLQMEIRVEAESIWSWDICSADEGDEAWGTVYDEGPWENYDGVTRVQRRCEAVARAISGDRQRRTREKDETDEK